MNWVSKISFLFACSFYLCHILFFWLYETTDSWFYWALANFFKTGSYLAPPPYFYTVPSTMEPPLYSFFLYIIEIFPRPDILIHIIQTASLFASAFFIYKILSSFIHKSLSLFFVSLFLIWPVNIIYVTNLLSENFALFGVSLFGFLAFQILEKKKRIYIPILIVFSSILVLLRYNFTTLFICSLLLAFFEVLNRGERTIQKVTILIAVAISLTILLSWSILNYKLNGSIGLSNGFGKSLYDRIIAQNHLVPPLDNPKLITLRNLTNDQVNLFTAWWFPEAHIMITKKSPLYSTETQINSLFADVATEGLKANMIPYIVDVPKYYFQAYFNIPPFPPSRYLATSVLLEKRRCRSLGTIEFCKSILQSDWMKKVWDTVVVLSEKYYYTFNELVFFVIILPSIVISLISKNSFFRFVALSYFLSVFIPTLINHQDPRYVYPLLSLEMLLVINVARTVFGKWIQPQIETRQKVLLSVQ